MYKIYHILPCVAVLLFAACANDDMQNERNADAIELAGIRVSIDNGAGATRAAQPTGTMPPALEDSIGRTSFGAHDKLVFTKICRTNNPLTQYTYGPISFSHNNGSWEIEGLNGGTANKIYWSDGANGHTFIGYCLPHKTTEAAVTKGTGANFDWYEYVPSGGGTHVFYGSIGDPDRTDEDIDYNATDDQSVPQNLRKEDLLLTYDTGIRNLDGEPIADIVCHHALASVRVNVSITGFSTSDNDKDADSKVYNLYLDNQPVMYKWDQTSYSAEGLEEGDGYRTDDLWDQRKKMKLWQPHPDGSGTGSGRSFTFYGINVPGTYDVPISFTVEYPDPMRPEGTRLLKTYNATLSDAQFRAGFCTSITISLNHKNEEITVGAEYMSWEYVDTPDEGNLFKNSTFLQSADRSRVTILGDSKATADDATWLYLDKDNQNRTVIKDIYGNPGTYDQPFVIKSADQLLSFCYEVNGGTEAEPRETAVNFVNIQPNQTTDLVHFNLNRNDGFSFEKYYITLDAGLYLQADTTTTATDVVWPGIGVPPSDADKEGKPFQGRFMAGVRIIKALNGAPLFRYIGPLGHIDQLILEDVISCTGNGAFVELNAGVLCACKVGSKKKNNVTFEITGSKSYTNERLNSTAVYVGSLCGRNDGALIACYSTANFKATNADSIGGIVGLNNGDVICNYAANYIRTQKSGARVYGIAGGMGQTMADSGEPVEPGSSSSAARRTSSTRTSGTEPQPAHFFFSIFDRDVNSSVQTKDPPAQYQSMDLKVDDMEALGVTTTHMQSNEVVGGMGNYGINDEVPMPTHLSLNGILEYWAHTPAVWTKRLKAAYYNAGYTNSIIITHLSERYFVYHVVEYPWVY